MNLKLKLIEHIPAYLRENGMHIGFVSPSTIGTILFKRSIAMS